MAAAALVCALVLAGCPSPSGPGGDDGPKVVAAKYRVSSGRWRNTTPWNSVAGVSGAVPVLGENTFTVTGGGENISLTGVYTVEGGLSGNDSFPGTWAYLYDGTGKIGIVKSNPNGGGAQPTVWVFLGQTMIGSWGNFTVPYDGLNEGYRPLPVTTGYSNAVVGTITRGASE